MQVAFHARIFLFENCCVNFYQRPNLSKNVFSFFFPEVGLAATDSRFIQLFNSSVTILTFHFLASLSPTSPSFSLFNFVSLSLSLISFLPLFQHFFLYHYFFPPLCPLPSYFLSLCPSLTSSFLFLSILFCLYAMFVISFIFSTCIHLRMKYVAHTSNILIRQTLDVSF